MDTVVTLESLQAQLVALTKAVQALTPPKLVSVAQAALALGSSQKTVRRMVADGRLPSVRVGRSVRVDLRGL